MFMYIPKEGGARNCDAQRPTLLLSTSFAYPVFHIYDTAKGKIGRAHSLKRISDNQESKNKLFRPTG